MLNVGNLRPSSISGIKRLAKRIKQETGCAYSAALDEASRQGGFGNFANAQRALMADSVLSSPSTPASFETLQPVVSDEELFDLLPQTPEQKRGNELENRFADLQARREEWSHERARMHYSSSGGRSSDWNYIEPNQSMQIAYHESVDERAFSRESNIEDLLSSTVRGRRSNAISKADLDRIEGEIRRYSAYLGIDYEDLEDGNYL